MFRLWKTGLEASPSAEGHTIEITKHNSVSARQIWDLPEISIIRSFSCVLASGQQARLSSEDAVLHRPEAVLAVNHHHLPQCVDNYTLRC